MIPKWVFLAVGAFVVGAVVVGIWATVAMFTGPADRPPAVSLTPVSAAAPTADVPKPSPSPSPNDLVAQAQRIKPLEDIQKGDRVLYQGHVCTWQLWNKNINTSTIKCPGQNEFQIQTGRLTPVELKDGPSKLKVEH